MSILKRRKSGGGDLGFTLGGQVLASFGVSPATPSDSTENLKASQTDALPKGTAPPISSGSSPLCHGAPNPARSNTYPTSPSAPRATIHFQNRLARPLSPSSPLPSQSQPLLPSPHPF